MLAFCWSVARRAGATYCRTYLPCAADRRIGALHGPPVHVFTRDFEHNAAEPHLVFLGNARRLDTLTALCYTGIQPLVSVAHPGVHELFPVLGWQGSDTDAGSLELRNLRIACAAVERTQRPCSKYAGPWRVDRCCVCQAGALRS